MSPELPLYAPNTEKTLPQSRKPIHIALFAADKNLSGKTGSYKWGGNYYWRSEETEAFSGTRQSETRPVCVPQMTIRFHEYL